jgi:hypothetical protein
MLKSPLASSVTPVWVEVEALALAAGPQKSVAKNVQPSALSDAIAAAQKQAASVKTDMPIGANSRIEAGDDPYLAGRRNTPYNVRGGCRNWGHCCVDDDIGDRNHPDAALECYERVFPHTVCQGRQRGENEEQEPET